MISVMCMNQRLHSFLRQVSVNSYGTLSPRDNRNRKSQIARLARDQ
jgi:hypothetical protein